MSEIQEACKALYEQVYEAAPKDGCLVTPDGDTVYLFRGGSWRPLCPVVSGEPGERMEFEIFPDLVIESDPKGLMEIVMTAAGMEPANSVEVAKLFFRIFQEAGWSGPATQLPDKVPGNVCVSWYDSSEAKDVDDIRPVLSQLHDGEFNGMLVARTTTGETYCWNTRSCRTVEVEAEK